MAELTTEELAALLKQLDDVCRQAQELSTEIRKRMLAAKRGDQRMDTADDPGARRARRPRTGSA